MYNNMLCYQFYFNVEKLISLLSRYMNHCDIYQAKYRDSDSTTTYNRIWPLKLQRK